MHSLLRLALTAIILTFYCVGTSASVQADVTFVTKTTQYVPIANMNKITAKPEKYALQERNSSSVTYASRHKLRVDSGIISIIYDQDAGKQWVINNQTKTYTESPYDINQAWNRYKQNKQVQQYLKVIDTGQISKRLGHTVRRYRMELMLPGNPKTTMTTDIFAAQDLPEIDLGANSYSGTEIRGIPLITIQKSKTTGTGNFGEGRDNSWTVKSIVTSISTISIPATRFMIPADYRLSVMPDYHLPANLPTGGHQLSR